MGETSFSQDIKVLLCERHTSTVTSHCSAAICRPFLSESTFRSMPRSKVEAGELTEPAFMDELQRRMERVVLGLQSGSYAQRVQVSKTYEWKKTLAL